MTVTTLTKAGRYEIHGELGRGAMGVVYRAHDPVIGRDVAVKTMQLSEAGTGMSRPELISRFQTEARAAGLLTHPNIVVVYDAGEEEGVFYITMELVVGRSLQTLFDARQIFPFPRVMHIMEQVCSALGFAHKRHVIHRDVKPANLMLTADDAVKITDFGTAKIMQFGTAQTAHVMGTPSYMSPEQVKGKPVDGRSDIFSLGVILYELMTGEKPFPGQNITTVIYKIINEEPIPPRALDSQIHEGISRVITRALAKDPADRYQNCQEMLEALKNYRDLVNPSATARIAAAKAKAANDVDRSATKQASPTVQPIYYKEESSSAGHHAPERSAPKTLLLSILVLGIIGFAGFRVWPVGMYIWEHRHQTVSASSTQVGDAPSIPPVTPSASTVSGSGLSSVPSQDTNPTRGSAVESPGVIPVGEPAALNEANPIHEVPPLAAAKSSTVAATTTAPIAHPLASSQAVRPFSAASSLKSQLNSDLFKLSLSNRVRVSIVGSTVTLSGRLTSHEHGELLAHLHGLPAGVYVIDDIESAEDSK